MAVMFLQLPSRPPSGMILSAMSFLGIPRGFLSGGSFSAMRRPWAVPVRIQAKCSREGPRAERLHEGFTARRRRGAHAVGNPPSSSVRKCRSRAPKTALTGLRGRRLPSWDMLRRWWHITSFVHSTRGARGWTRRARREGREGRRRRHLGKGPSRATKGRPAFRKEVPRSALPGGTPGVG